MMENESFKCVHLQGNSRRLRFLFLWIGLWAFSFIFLLFCILHKLCDCSSGIETILVCRIVVRILISWDELTKGDGKKCDSPSILCKAICKWTSLTKLCSLSKLFLWLVVIVTSCHCIPIWFNILGHFASHSQFVLHLFLFSYSQFYAHRDGI